MTIKKFIFSVITLGFIALISCEEEVDNRESDELIRLEAYMNIHYPDVEPTASGLYYIPISEGDGASPEAGNYLLFEITGQNLDGDVFETTIEHTAYLHDIISPKTRYAPKFRKFKDEEDPIIEGLSEGFSYMHEGDSVRLIMPSSLAYGSTRYQGLKPFSSVIYDVKLKRIITNPEAYEQELITNYINENYPLEPSEYLQNGIYLLEGPTASNHQKEDEENTEPQPIVDGDKVSLYYTGSLVDSWIFDTNDMEVAQENNIYESDNDYAPLSVTVGEEGFIEGFSLALEILQTHSTAKVIIPSEYGYGEEGTETIPPYSPLIFDLEILSKSDSDDSGDEPEE
ncbi:MAG: FKBP-type peptidyl-prolyl cis-trans isomerase [Bacteroidales bacterium]